MAWQTAQAFIFDNLKFDGNRPALENAGVTCIWKGDAAMQEMYLERESDMPANWVSNVIFERDGKGVVFMVDVPDDAEEVTEIVGND